MTEASNMSESLGSTSKNREQRPPPILLPESKDSAEPLLPPVNSTIAPTTGNLSTKMSSPVEPSADDVPQASDNALPTPLPVMAETTVSVADSNIPNSTTNQSLENAPNKPIEKDTTASSSDQTLPAPVLRLITAPLQEQTTQSSVHKESPNITEEKPADNSSSGSLVMHNGTESNVTEEVPVLDAAVTLETVVETTETLLVPETIKALEPTQALNSTETLAAGPALSVGPAPEQTPITPPAQSGPEDTSIPGPLKEGNSTGAPVKDVVPSLKTDAATVATATPA